MEMTSVPAQLTARYSGVSSPVASVAVAPGGIASMSLAAGTPDSFLASGLNKVLSWFGIGATTEGVIYSFGFTLFVGTLMNFVMGVLASRLMVTSLAKFKFLRNKKFFGGDSNE